MIRKVPFCCFIVLGLMLISLYSCDTKSSSEFTETDTNETGAEGYWYNKPLRIVQTVLREKDAKNYDTLEVVTYLKENNANTLVINAGGIVDFFQNPLPASNINPFLGNRDLLREIVKACHNTDIRVIARVDFRGVEKHVYEKHPDWFGVHYKGNPNLLTYNSPTLYAPCYLSYYRNEHAKEFISYLFEEYHIDGIWHNSVHVGGICWCERCQKEYHSSLGKSIPAPNASKEQLDEYYVWKAKIAENYLASMRETVKKYGEDKAYSAEVFGMFDVNLPIHSGIDLYSGARYFDFLLSVGFLSNNTTQIEYKDLGYPAGHIRFLKSLAPEKQAVILFGTNGTSHRYIADPTEDLKVWMWETISSGGGLWNCNFTGMYPAKTQDNRNAYLTQVPYHYIKQNEQIFQHQEPYAPVKILYSKATRTFFGEDDPFLDNFGAPISGMEKVLQENHIPYGFIPDYKLDEENLAECKLLILPNVACLSYEQTATITNYVKKGGKLLATYATSLYNEKGEQRENFTLSDLFGCSYDHKTYDTRKDAYQYIMNRNEILKGFDKTTMLMNGASTLACKKTETQAKVLTQLVPVLNNQPPEKAWKDTLYVESPVLVYNQIGSGKVVYFANQPDKLTSIMGHQDFRDLLSNAIDYLEPNRIISTDAPESIHINITHNSRKKCFIISLINLTSAPERPLRKIIPVHSIKVDVTLPPDEVISRYHLLTDEIDTEFEIKSKNTLEIKIAEINEFESIVVYYK